MGIVDSIENALERLMRNAFSRGSKARVEPVEIASAVRKNMDSNAMTLTAGRTLAPNNFRIHLSSADYKRASTWGAALAEELCELIIKYAHSQHYILAGPARVSFAQDPEVRMGDISILATNDQRPAKKPRSVVPPPRSSATYDLTRTLQSSPSEPMRLEVEGKIFTLKESPVTIGRSVSSTVTIPSADVSRDHARIDLGSVPTIMDLGSTNGTFVNDKKVTEPTPLYDGDVIQVGQTQIFFSGNPQKGGL